MNLKRLLFVICTIICCCNFLQAQTNIYKKELVIKKSTTSNIKIDGQLTEPVWANAQSASKFITLRPEPFIADSVENYSDVRFTYTNEGIYVGGYFHEKNKDSIASELIGRDGFGNNDFVGVIFDTYHDNINGFEYFLTPLGEQMDAKLSNASGEDFSWNAVWEGASKIQPDGWSFEMFIPFSAIRFGKSKQQTWGLNIVRRRQKCGQQLFWQPIDPNVNGFLTQEGTMKGLENIKPPIRLQLSPYFSSYAIHDDNVEDGMSKSSYPVNGGMDLKYGINQAFTLDMTLIPDFGQVQADNRILNLTPFEQQFAENRTFFTEGTELFSKGNLFYSRRIGGTPFHYWDVKGSLQDGEKIVSIPGQSKLLNATKISGRTQSGWGVGVLNAVTQKQYATIENADKETYKVEVDPLTNYNILVVDKTLKNNSNVSLINTSVIRSGHDYDANVTSMLFDLYDKKNTWNFGGNVSRSSLLYGKGSNINGYAHSLWFGKTSGRLNFNVWQDLINDKYNKGDLGYFTNNNTMDQGLWMGYKWLKPRAWYNQIRLNFNAWYSRLVSPLDVLKRKEMMYQGASFNINGNAQTKKLWQIGGGIFFNAKQNDFYEPRVSGRFFTNKPMFSTNLWWNSNSAKKYSWGGDGNIELGGIFNQVNVSGSLYLNARFNSKVSVNQSSYLRVGKRLSGWASSTETGNDPLDALIYFSKRDIYSVENVLSFKYSFTNRMGLNIRARHYWSKVDPKEFFELNTKGGLDKPTTDFSENVNQNYNYFTVDMLYNWQFAQGSFLSVVWKNIAESFERSFENGYFDNLGKTVTGPQYNSISIRVIYFIDYLTAKKALKKKKNTSI